MARPKKEINWDVVEKLMEARATANEIAGKFRINHDTFYRRFKEEFEISYQDYQSMPQGAGIADLKLMQHAKALNNSAPGNANLLIWLGKVLWGQKEPDAVPEKPPNHDEIDKDHTIMQLKYELEKIRAAGNQPQTG